MNMEAAIKDLQTRVSKLETLIGNTSKEILAPQDESFKGATGGVRLLIQDGFFDTTKSRLEVTSEMSQRGYHYSRQAIQIALSRLSKKGGPLVSLNNKGTNHYAVRK